ncbi:hypothetical protein HMPREF1635_01400 [Clostridiales bacterium S5-A14a]|nr:hypothetical protein HMPREF1635_01400 [Clostridiales bacterium S5-A14a]
MTKPALIIMAAGMGSRYGGLKQVDPVTPEGEILLDFSLYDAMMAGFEDVVFIIRKEHREAFDNLLKDRAGKHLSIHYAYQELSDLPEGFEVPDGRTKPWGTCHAVMACRDIVKGPFAVINADDYYGPSAFMQIYDFLSSAISSGDNHSDNDGLTSKDSGNNSRASEISHEILQDNKISDFAMVGYMLPNTLSESGHVARGVCQISDSGYLSDIVERTKIMRRHIDPNFKSNSGSVETKNSVSQRGSEIAYEDGETGNWIPLSEDTIVSMNFWGFTQSFMKAMIDNFPAFLEESLKTDPLKAEYFLPFIVDKMIVAGSARVKVLPSKDRWYGMTYKEDKPLVTAALQSMKDKGLYPDKLWK